MIVLYDFITLMERIGSHNKLSQMLTIIQFGVGLLIQMEHILLRVAPILVLKYDKTLKYPKVYIFIIRYGKKEMTTIGYNM